MCYNKMYAYEFPQVGFIAKSKYGHDEGRLYIVAAVINKDFVLLIDGEYRKLDKPKTKRVKHLKPCGFCAEAAEAIASGKLTDSAARKLIKAFTVNQP